MNIPFLFLFSLVTCLTFSSSAAFVTMGLPVPLVTISPFLTVLSYPAARKHCSRQKLGGPFFCFSQRLPFLPVYRPIWAFSAPTVLPTPNQPCSETDRAFSYVTPFSPPSTVVLELRHFSSKVELSSHDFYLYPFLTALAVLLLRIRINGYTPIKGRLLLNRLDLRPPLEKLLPDMKQPNSLCHPPPIRHVHDICFSNRRVLSFFLARTIIVFARPDPGPSGHLSTPILISVDNC